MGGSILFDAKLPMFVVYCNEIKLRYALAILWL